jgi:exonuclease III
MVIFFCFFMESSCFLIWNVRGLNDHAKRDSFKTLVLDIKPSIVCLQKTKLCSISDFDILSILGAGFSNFVYSSAQGTRGGVLIAWRDGSFVSVDSVVKNFFVSVQFQESGSCWWFTGVYGPHQDNLKQAFLQELRMVREECAGPWILCGDFNLIYREEDKNNSNINRTMLGNFRGLVNSLDLKEIPLIGRRFTWLDQREEPTLVKLDHVFCATNWEDSFPNCSLHSNAASVSDHYPLTLKVREVCLGKRRFHFESFWPKIPRFLDVVAASWNQPLIGFLPYGEGIIEVKKIS